MFEFDRSILTCLNQRKELTVLYGLMDEQTDQNYRKALLLRIYFLFLEHFNDIITDLRTDLK